MTLETTIDTEWSTEGWEGQLDYRQLENKPIREQHWFSKGGNRAPGSISCDPELEIQ